MSALSSVQRSEIYNKTLHLTHVEQEKNWPIIQKLYGERDHLQRRGLFGELAKLNVELFNGIKTIFEQNHVHALSKGRESVLELCLGADEDRIAWRDLFLTPKFREIRKAYAASYAAERRHVLELENFSSWDFWLQSPREITMDNRHLFLTGEKDDPLPLLRKFLTLIGYESLFAKIHWIPNRESTVARLEIDKNGHLITSIYISESSIHAKTGSLAFFSLAAHETGHVIQAHANTKPQTDNLAPLMPLREIISMFFQKLFLSAPVLRALTDWDTDKIAAIGKKTDFEDGESLARYLCYLEFEIRLYELIAANQFQPEAVSRTWKDLKRDYFGFDAFDEDDHSWQNSSYYLLYHPFYQRSYILGEVFSRLILQRYLTQSEGRLDSKAAQSLLCEIIQGCSDKGTGNTWQDYERIAGVTSLGATSLLPLIAASLGIRRGE